MINSEQLSAALQRLDPRDWEVLDLSLRRRVPDEALARLFATEPPEVARRRAFAIEHLADELGVKRGEDLGAVLKALLEPATWEEAEREQGDGWQGFPDPQGAPGPARPPGEDHPTAPPVAQEPPVQEPPSSEPPVGEPPDENPPAQEPPSEAAPAQEPPPAETAAPAEPPRSSETARHFRLTPPPELPPLDMERDRPAAEGEPGADDESPVWPPASRAGRGAAAPASAARAAAEPPPEPDESAPSEAGEPEPPASPPPASEPSPARPPHLAAVPPATEGPASTERDAAEEQPADETPVADGTEEGGGEETPVAESTEEGGDEGTPAVGAPAQDEPAEEQPAADGSATAEEESDLDEASPPTPVQAPSDELSAASAPGESAVPKAPEPVLDMLAERDQEERRQRIRTPVLLALAGGLGAVGLFAAGYVGAHWFGGDDTQRAGGGGGGPRRFLPSAVGPMAEPFPSDVRDASCYPTAAVDRNVTLYRRPGSRKTLKLPARTEWDSPRVLSVVRRSGDWLAVLAPELKNGEVGWMRSKGAKLDCVRWSVHVDLSRRRLYVRKDGHTMRTMTIAVGSSSHPTPKGRFAVTDKLKVVDKGSPYGCCVLALTGHQTRLPADWPGGDRLAVHATSDLSSIGKPVSLGCMRSQPSQVNWLIKTVPLGAPVFIRS